MKVKVKMYPGAVKALTNAQKQAAMMTGEQMLHEIVSDAVIPFDTGNLQNVGTYVDNSEVSKGLVKIAHDTPYATRLYFHPEYDFDTTINANARGEWWDEWLNGAKQSRPMKLFRQFYRKLTGGIVK